MFRSEDRPSQVLSESDFIAPGASDVSFLFCTRAKQTFFLQMRRG